MSAGFVRLGDVRRVVVNCAKNGDLILTTHRWKAVGNGKTAFLSKGAHKADPEIRTKKAMHAFAQLDIDEECIRKHL
jgi:hypothetical protein